MRAALLSLLLTACSGLGMEPVSQYLSAGSFRREYYVKSESEARTLVAQKKRFLELLLESIRSAPHIGHPLTCLEEQKIIGPFNKGLRFGAFIYTSSPHNLGLPAGTCMNTGTRLSAIFYDYCPRLGIVVEVQFRAGVITNFKRLDLCN